MPIENEEIAEVMRKRYSAWNSGDMNTLAQVDAGEMGYGFRARAWRDSRKLGLETHKGILTKFRNSLEYFHIELEELNTSAEGNIGLAWGFHLERFKLKGRPPEQARVRFSIVFKNEAGIWRTIMYHRDIQPCDKKGRYLTEFTKT